MNNLDLWKRSPNPFSDIGNIDRMMNGFFTNDYLSDIPAEMRKGISARCEVSETPQTYNLKFEAPGLKKEDIKVDLHDNRLTVSGERREEKHEERDRKVHYSEMKYGSFMRSFTFPNPVDAERVEAKFENGVLSISVTKSSNNRSRQITIR